MQKLIFLHIPKTAGTSLRVSLSEHYSEDETFPHFDMSSVDSELVLQSMEKYNLFFGHFNAALFPNDVSDMGFVKAVFLRNPVDRVFSEYHYYKRFTHEFAKKTGGILEIVSNCSSIEDYLESEEFDAKFRAYNLQSKYLVQKVFGQPNYQDEDELFAKAKAVLDGIDVIGATEYMEASTTRLGKAIGANLTLPDRRLNSINEAAAFSKSDYSDHPEVNNLRAIKIEPLSDKCRNRILALNQVDLRLYEYVISQLDRDS